MRNTPKQRGTNRLRTGRARITLAVVTIVSLGLTVLPGPAQAAPLPPTHVGCGQTITESIRVANPLDCTGDGLVVGAPDITIDLGGHRISGDGDAGDNGIQNIGHDGVKVKNGTIAGFEHGVFFSGVADGVLAGLHVVGNADNGIFLTLFSENNTLKANRAVRNGGHGILIALSTDTTLKGNKALANTADGIRLANSGNNTLKGNTAPGNDFAGIALFNASHFNTLKGNQASGNGSEGILLDSSRDNTLKGNRSWANGIDGIALLNNADSNTFKKNKAWANFFDGIFLDATSGGNTLKANKAWANSSDGIRALSGSNTIIKNLVRENGRHGMPSGSATNTLTKNKAHRNGYLNGGNGGRGITSPAGTQGSGNKAGGNDDPAQCTPAELCSGTGGVQAPDVLVSCGETITDSVKLANPLLCTGDGLVVGAPDITIDLGGHRIQGPRIFDVGSPGIDNTAGHDGVKVESGIVAGFMFGVHLVDATGNTLKGLHLVDNGSGTSLASSPGSTLKGNRASRNFADGLILTSSPGSTLKGNTASGNRQSGIFLGSSLGSTLKGNTASGNKMFDGIHLRSSTGSTLKGNTASGNAGDGIELKDSSDDNLLKDNSAGENGRNGILLDSSDGNRLKGNAAAANASLGIILDSSSRDNALKGNRTSGNGEQGIFVNGASTGNVLKKNAAHENGVQGITSDTADVTLLANEANRNGFLNGIDDDAGLGINVPAGTTNSKNKAKGNDDPNQCEASDVNCHVPTP